jgi:hypothetical protein
MPSMTARINGRGLRVDCAFTQAVRRIAQEAASEIDDELLGSPAVPSVGSTSHSEAAVAAAARLHSAEPSSATMNGSLCFISLEM